RIYDGHLQVARTLAEEHGMEITTSLLDGKPHEAIGKYLRGIDPSLLVLGKVGIHADAELDIGSNSEQLLHDAPCAVLLSQREHQPAVDLLASVSTSWTAEAEQRMQKVPSFVRDMARMAILRYAQERGHTVITERIVEEATAALMPGHARRAMAEIVAAHDAGELKGASGEEIMSWSEEAETLLQTVEEPPLRGNLAMRAEKRARQDGCTVVEPRHVTPFLESPPADPGGRIHWQAAALARLARVPEGFMRDTARRHIEEHARGYGHREITLEIAEQGLATAREEMAKQMQKPGGPP
ncbi:MAG TPA: universal stress protein UspA, partial [Gammaproteobacteria bacterium]|nr:universal stress protein UspA [Gammaproteobacteria bacterium]